MCSLWPYYELFHTYHRIGPGTLCFHFGKVILQVTLARDTQFQQMSVFAPRTANCLCHLEQCIEKGFRGKLVFSVALEEAWDRSAPEGRVLAPQLGCQRTGAAEEYDVALHLRASSLLSEKQVPRDEHVVRILVAIHIDPAQLWRDSNSMNSIGHEVLHPLGPAQRLALDAAEADIVTYARDCTAGLLSSQRPSAGLLLVDNLNRGTGEDSGLAYLLPC